MKIKPKIGHIVFFLYLLLLLVIIPREIYANKELAKIIHISDQERISMIVRGFENAINNPNPYNLKVLAPYINSDQKAAIEEKLQYFRDTKESYDKQFDFGIEQQIRIGINSISDNGGECYNVFTGISISINQFSNAEVIPLLFTKDGNNWILSSLTTYIGAVNRFIDESQVKAVPELEPVKGSRNKGPKEIQDYQSDGMLISQMLYPDQDLYRFTTTESRRLFNNNIIFGHPYDFLPVIYKSQYLLLNHHFLIIADPAWNRFIATNVAKDWITAIGAYGSGAYGFRQPKGIAYICPDGYIVADQYNYRASVYKMTDHYEGEFAYVTSLQNNNGAIVDVASGKYYNGARQVALLDHDSCRVDIYNVVYIDEPIEYYFFQFDRSLFSNGSDSGQLNGPTSICFGKSWINQFHIPYIYIADARNKRIVGYDIDDDEVFMSDYQFPDNTFLTSVDMGHFGEVYVVDRYNCKIYVFNFDLDSLIAIYGSRGEGDKELAFPFTFRTTECYEMVYTNPNLLPVADAFITEQFDENTGIRRYHLSNEVLWYNIDYDLVDSGGFNNIVFDWHQSGAAITTEKINIRCGSIDTLIRDVTYEYSLAGCNDMWLHPYEAPRKNGYHILEVTLNSAYGNNTTVIKDSVYIAYPEQPQYITADDCGYENGPMIQLNWNHVNYCCVSHYDVYRNDEYLVSVPRLTTSYQDTGVTLGMEYSYKVRSRWENTFYSEFSPIATVTPSEYMPAAPSNVQATQSTTSCDWTVTWQDNSDNETGFMIYLEKVFPQNSYEIISYVDTPNVTSYLYVDNELDAQYNWRVYSYRPDNCEPDCGYYQGHPCDCDNLLCNANIYGSTSLHSGPCSEVTCPYLYVWSGNQYTVDNNLLAISSSSKKKSDDYIEYHKVSVIPEHINGQFRFKIMEAEQDISQFDQFELFAVDKNITGEIVIDNSANIYTTLEKIKPALVVDQYGFDITDLVNERDGRFFYSGTPGYVEITYVFEPDKGFPMKVPEDDGSISDPPIKGGSGHSDKVTLPGEKDIVPSRLDVYIEQNGQWVLIDSAYGQTYQNEPIYSPTTVYEKSGDTLRMKYQWNYVYRADEMAFLRTKEYSDPPIKIPLTAANHTGDGDILSYLLNSDNNRIGLNPDDTITLFFDNPGGISGNDYKFVMKVEGFYQIIKSDNVNANTNAKTTDSTLLPIAFEFEQNYPNPFNPSTIFSFAVPKTSQVKLDIINILGQKVITLLDKTYEPGFYDFEWNNNELGSGVYFAKFRAGEFSSTRKVVILK